MKIAIIGAGFSGMAAAWDLRRAGNEVTIYEAADYVGGLASGFKEPGWDWSVEKFYHHWFASDKYMLGLVEELGWSEKVIFPRPYTVMYYKDQWYPFDSILKAILFPGLGWGLNKIRFGLVGLFLRLTNNWWPLEKDTVDAWMRKWAGEKVYQLMWEPLVFGKFGEYHYKEVNMAWMWARIKARTTRLAKQVKKSGYLVTSLQGDLSQNKRQEAISGFRSGKYRVLVATDIAARGIDVSRVSHVINYDIPDTIDAYTHRIGRTGRAERTGEAFTFVTQPDRAFVQSIENVLGETLERRTLAGFDYGKPAPEGGEGCGRSLHVRRQPLTAGASIKTPARHAHASSPVSASGARKGRKDLSQCPFIIGSPRMKSDRHQSVR